MIPGLCAYAPSCDRNPIFELQFLQELYLSTVLAPSTLLSVGRSLNLVLEACVTPFPSSSIVRYHYWMTVGHFFTVVSNSWRHPHSTCRGRTECISR